MSGPRVDCAALAEVYGQGAASYDALWSPVIQPPALAVIAELELGATNRVLDVGAGTGALTNALRFAAPRAFIVSVDAASEMLHYAREHRRATCALASAAGLPFAPSSVDAVLLAYVLFHLLDPRAAVREAARVLRVSDHRNSRSAIIGIRVACSGSLAGGGVSGASFGWVRWRRSRGRCVHAAARRGRGC